MARLEEKVVLVTGSSTGIGRGIARRLVKEGADVIINSHKGDEKAQAALAELQAFNGRACFIQADVAQVDECRRLLHQSINQMGRVDILVNNAGVQKRTPFLEAAEDDYDWVMGVNLKGPFFLTQAFAQHLVDSGRKGHVINISSVHEELAFPNFTSYCASKGGMKMLMRNLAVELAPYGITVNNVAPGAIQTPINRSLMNQPDKLESLMENIPLNRLGEVDDVAGAVAYLASADAAYVTGTTLFVDGGLIRHYTEQ